MTAAWGAVIGVLLAGVSRGQAQPTAVDERIPGYAQERGITGNASSMGSDTMNNLMALWLEGFRRHYPNVKIQIEGKGSGTAPPALRRVPRLRLSASSWATCRWPSAMRPAR